jgi:hypothetical protein
MSKSTKNFIFRLAIAAITLKVSSDASSKMESIIGGADSGDTEGLFSVAVRRRTTEGTTLPNTKPQNRAQASK